MKTICKGNIFFVTIPLSFQHAVKYLFFVFFCIFAKIFIHKFTNMKKLMLTLVAILSFAACTPEQIEPLPENRTDYVVTQITWYADASNHKEATYEYNDKNQLIKRTLNCTFEEWNGVKHSVCVDSLYYQDGRVCKITQTENGLYRPDRLFFYDNDGRLIRTEYGSNVTCYAYHNGLLDSIYSSVNSKQYTTLEYDSRGNVVKQHTLYPKMNSYGEPTGEYEMRTYEYEYDNNPRPNFNIDNVFTYEPIFGMGTSYPTYVRNISPNNMTRYSGGPEIWEYTYNEQGLPLTMIDETRTPYKFTYRRVR